MKVTATSEFHGTLSTTFTTTAPERIEAGMLRWRYDGTNWWLRNGRTWVDAASGATATKAQSDALWAASRERDEILSQADADEDARR